MSDARLIALDWGSTRLRAFLLGADGAVLETRQSGQGASTLAGKAAFEQAFSAVTADWPGLPALACGMVGSQHGWREAPYAPCPADAAALARHALKLDERISILPGLMHDGGQPDVMRGEETQIVGALALHPDLAARACLVLPGTHSKWARVEAGRVTGFATHMTGELYALLRQHSVLARLMPADGASPPSSQAFLAGVDAARKEGALSHQLFAVRTLGLFKRLAAEQLPDYLSGLLIGHEIAHELAGGAPGRLALVGDPALCERYALALGRFGVTAPLQLDNTAPAGLWQLAQTMGL
ncbi:2-dehydro-3-deoxygalactonokinase [Pelomonas saccharophila]|uniref:2-dehydro-3-deoxygalactonokinase n=1 Tax=Roseateles saccharophilus TaxID=304 RepID=A0ABU1YEZ3_ROSSA|nr:2-dehydro-3-deoxygalactonokinase [Roseateles saccharophilus]MDR7267430.1 2-dehydro-3-deoxygalactonokinase [Roseateles saccharophilus]